MFLQHINSIDPYIKFTVEATRPDGSMLSLDTLMMPGPDGTLVSTVYWKSSHTAHYLLWDSYHTLAAMYSVINTLAYRAKSSTPALQLLRKEEHLKQALQNCKYPNWALNRAKIRSKLHNKPTWNSSGITSNNSAQTKNKNIHMVAPYTKELSEN